MGFLKLEPSEQGNKKEDLNAGLYRRINRILANKLANIIKHAPVTPNHLTFLLFIFNFALAYLFLKNNPNCNIIAGIGILVYYLVDQLNGSLARITNKASNLGTWYDHINDAFGLILIYLAISIGIYTKSNNYTTIIFAFAAASAYLFKDLMLNLYKNLVPNQTAIEEIKKKKILGWFIRNFSYDGVFIMPFLAFFAIINKLEIALITLGSYGGVFILIQYVYLAAKIKQHDKISQHK